MKGLLFVSRVALLCNLCYVFSVAGRYVASLDRLLDSIISTVVILGVVAVFLNAFVNIAWLVTTAFKKQGIPKWLGITNLVIFIFQVLNMFIFQL